MPRKGANVSLSSYDDIFSTEQSRTEAGQEHVQEIPVEELHPFEGHPFKVLDNEEMGIVVHDHDRTFYRYGQGHQECIQHDCRYLIGSKENEPEREWNHQMHDLIREMLHYRNGLGASEPPDPGKIAEFERRYDKILSHAEKEYKEEPPSEYYREGYNLFLRLREYKESELRFLHDMRVPANNSLCERLARVYKRKQKQAITLRSQESLGYICDGLSVVYLLRSQKEGSVYKEICNIYSRKRPVKPQAETTGTNA